MWGRHAVHDGVGGEDPSEVVRGEVQRVAGRVSESGGRERVLEEVTDASDGDRPVFQPDLALKQQRHGRVPDLFVVVVGDYERDAAVSGADAADDRGEDVGEFRRDDQQPFLVGLGRGDLQERNEFAGARQPVLDQAVVRDLAQLLDPDAGHAQDLDRGPAPEGVALLPPGSGAGGWRVLQPKGAASAA